MAVPQLLVERPEERRVVPVLVVCVLPAVGDEELAQRRLGVNNPGDGRRLGQPLVAVVVEDRERPQPRRGHHQLGDHGLCLLGNEKEKNVRERI